MIIAEDDAKEAARLDEYREMAAKVEGKTLRIGVKAGTTCKIFGSVSVQIANALKEQFDLELERKKIHLPEEVKEVGTYTAELHLHKELHTKVQFELVQE